MEAHRGERSPPDDADHAAVTAHRQLEAALCELIDLEAKPGESWDEVRDRITLYVDSHLTHCEKH